jgi:2-dehydropantoate 2-reductase
VPIGAIRSHPQSRALLHDLMAEAVRVGQAEGVPLAADFAQQRLAFVDGLPAGMTSSMHHDLERGNRLEVPWLSGDVVARGARLGVATPCNRALFDLLAVHAEGRVA